jgi:hypothetical protein
LALVDLRIFFLSPQVLQRQFFSSLLGSRPHVSSGGVMEQAPATMSKTQPAPASEPVKPAGQSGEIPK